MDSKAKIKLDYRGDIRENFNESKRNSGRVSMSQVWSQVVTVRVQGELKTHNSKDNSQLKFI